MKKIILLILGLMVAFGGFAATNLVVIGHAATTFPSEHFFNRYRIPWQANLVPLFFFGVGIFHLFCPRACWYFKWGWRFADSEPSDLWLFFERAGGVLIMGFAFFLFLGVNGIISLHK